MAQARPKIQLDPLFSMMTPSSNLPIGREIMALYRSNLMHTTAKYGSLRRNERAVTYKCLQSPLIQTRARSKFVVKKIRKKVAYTSKNALNQLTHGNSGLSHQRAN